jgi:hypothetical protein
MAKLESIRKDQFEAERKAALLIQRLWRIYNKIVIKAREMKKKNMAGIDDRLKRILSNVTYEAYLYFRVCCVLSIDSSSSLFLSSLLYLHCLDVLCHKSTLPTRAMITKHTSMKYQS